MTLGQILLLVAWMGLITYLVIDTRMQVRKHAAAQQTQTPLPVDPDFPPTKMVYLQGEGAPERCSCHGRVIEDGTEILHWPQPAKLVCVRKDDAE